MLTRSRPTTPVDTDSLQHCRGTGHGETVEHLNSTTAGRRATHRTRRGGSETDWPRYHSYQRRSVSVRRRRVIGKLKTRKTIVCRHRNAGGSTARRDSEFWRGDRKTRTGRGLPRGVSKTAASIIRVPYRSQLSSVPN